MGNKEIVGVTVDDQVGGNYLVHVQYDYDVPVKLVVKNTIFSARGPDSPIFIRNNVDYSFECCLFYFPRSDFVVVYGERVYGSEDVEELGGSNRYGDPLFVRTGFGDKGDYHLRKGSPAIDLGVQIPLTIDLDGASRPYGEGFNVGAYEFGSTPTTPVLEPTLTPSPTLRPTPTPADRGVITFAPTTFTMIPSLVLIAIVALVLLRMFRVTNNIIIVPGRNSCNVLTSNKLV